MISILAFDTKAIISLFSEKFEPFMEKNEYPLIYRNKKVQSYKNQGNRVKTSKTFNAIDIAIENHQVRAVSIMIDYIIKHQNNWVSSFLFQGNLTNLMS